MFLHNVTFVSSIKNNSYKFKNEMKGILYSLDDFQSYPNVELIC
jgi:hypothetical protein